MRDNTAKFARMADKIRKKQGRENDNFELLRRLPDRSFLVLAANLQGWSEREVSENQAGEQMRTYDFYDVDKQNNQALRTFTHIRINGKVEVKKTPIEPRGSLQQWVLYTTAFNE